MKLDRIDLASIGVVAGMTAATVYTALQAPAGPLPTHMGLDGTVDRWGSRAEVAAVMAGVTAVAAAVAAFCAWLKRDPRSAEQAARAPVGFLVGRIAGLVAPALAVGLMAALAFGGLRPGEDQTSTVRLIMGGVSLLFLVLGVLLGKTSPNAFVGIRTYWSLTSRLAWDKSNRLAGRLFFWIGLLGLTATPFAPVPLGSQVLIAAVIASALWAVVESWRVWRVDPDRRVA